MNKISPDFLRPHPNNVTMAQKYATAFLNVHYPSPTQELIERFLNLYQFCKYKNRFFANLTQTKISLAEKSTSLSLLKQIFQLEDADLNFIKLILHTGKILSLATICKQIVSIATKKRGESIFLVSTSETLNQAQKKLVFNFLNKSLQQKSLVIFRTDAALISGIRIESDCILYEKSLKSRLKTTFITLRSIAE